MITGAVEQRPAAVVGQVAYYGDIVLVRFQRLQDAGQLIEFALIVGIPTIHHDAVRHIHKRHANRPLPGGAARSKSWNHSIEEWERNRGARPPEKCASGKRFSGDHFCALSTGFAVLCLGSPRRDWNGRLSGISQMMDWKG